MDLAIFKIYNRELTQAEITTSYNENLARFSTPIPSYGSGLVGTFYRTENFSSPYTTTTSNGGIVYPVGYGTNMEYEFSWEFNGYVQSDAGGTAILFLTFAGNGNTASLSVGGTVLINGSGYSFISLNAGVYYPIQIRYSRPFNIGGSLFTFSAAGATFHN
jgi:hypothetical protein